jgi:hypothetical protein
MTKTKLFMPLLLILVMGMATTAFGQLNCAVASGTISRATSTGHTEPVGDISFTCTPPAGATATGTATATVQYPVTITNSAAYPAGAPIRISDASGSFAAAGQVPTIATVSNVTNQVVINIPGQAAPAAGAFTLRGVLVSLAGTTASANLQANVSVSPPQTAGSNVLINSGDNTPTVITSIMPGINTTTAPPALVAGTTSALYLGTGANVVPTRAGFAITTTENYIDMFRSAFNMASNAATQSTQLTYTFSGMAPGSTIGPCAATIAPAGPTVTLSAATTAAAGAGGTASLTVSFTGVAAADSPSQTAIETVTLTCGTNAATVAASTPGFSAAGVAAAALPITAPITATVNLAPTGAALSAANAVLTGATTGQIPRYASTLISVGTVITFTPATTTMLIPYVVANGDASPAAGTFDTGIAIANTTGDPASFGTGSATDQAGTITFTFFPSNGGASFSVPTASVPAGGSFIGLVSDLMKSATPPVTGSFSGYAFAVANFTNGHGQAFVFGGTAANRLTSASDVLVLVSPAVQSRSSSPAGFPTVEYTTK